MKMRGKAPTFTSDAQGYLCNPLSDSGISWWHMTSPFTPDIEREGFRIPSYFSSDVDTLCGVAESMNRPNPISLYEVKLRIRPENLLSPQTIFKDWLQSWYLTSEDDDGNEWDAQNGEANPWFRSPAFVDTLTPLGKRFYYEVASAECYFSKAEIMSLVCDCVYNVFDILKNVGPNLFENWCLRNDIYGWVEAEFRDGGWVQDASEMWVPEEGFNIGVWDTSRVVIVNVFPDAVDCEEEWEASSVIGRKNPLDPSTKVQFSPDGYLINPLDGTTVWWHGYSYDVETLVRAGDIDDEDLEALYVEDKEFHEGGMNWAGVFFTPSREDAVMFARQFEYDTQFIVSARIRKCKLFDAREHSRYDLKWDTYEDEDVVRQLKAEGFEGYIELESESLEYFNVCIFNAPKYVEVIKNTNIARPENYLRLRTPRGRKNPKDYIINPNTGGRIWWYVTDEHSPEFRTGDEAHRFTWFGGVRQDWEDFGQFNLAIIKKYLLEVQIEAPAGCAVFDARTLFPSIPQWVEDSLRKSTQTDDEELDSEEGYEFIEIVRPMPIEADTYRFFQNMRIEDPSLNAFCSTFNSDWLRAEFLIKLWLLDWASVQDFLEGSEYTEEVDTPIVGWYEIERGDYNYHTAINLGLYMAKPANLASHFQRCSDIKVDIVNVISAK